MEHCNLSHRVTHAVTNNSLPHLSWWGQGVFLREESTSVKYLSERAALEPDCRRPGLWEELKTWLDKHEQDESESKQTRWGADAQTCKRRKMTKREAGVVTGSMEHDIKQSVTDQNSQCVPQQGGKRLLKC